jgi:hypothetical protein
VASVTLPSHKFNEVITMRVSGKVRMAVLLPAAAMLAILPFAQIGAMAQAPVVHHKNFVHRHPMLTSTAAGVGTYAALKMDAARKKRLHQKLNFADRHPMMMGLGAGVVTHHIIKKTDH